MCTWPKYTVDSNNIIICIKMIYILAFTCTSVTRRERMRNEDKAGTEGGGTEREDTRIQTEVVWTREENGRERVC